MKIIFFKNSIFLKTNAISSYNFIFPNDTYYKLHLKNAIYFEINFVLDKLFSVANIYYEENELKLKSDVNNVVSTTLYKDFPINYLIDITPFFDNIHNVRSPLVFSETYKILYPNENFKIKFKIYNKNFELNFLKIMENFNRYENNTFKEYLYIQIDKNLDYDSSIQALSETNSVNTTDNYTFTFNKYPTFLEYNLI